jgi:hypothetical protein
MPEAEFVPHSAQPCEPPLNEETPSAELESIF